MNLSYNEVLELLDPGATNIRITADPNEGTLPYFDAGLDNTFYFMSWVSPLYNDAAPPQSDIDDLLGSNPVGIPDPNTTLWGRVEFADGGNVNEIATSPIPLVAASLTTNSPDVAVDDDNVTILLPAGTWEFRVELNLFSTAQRACNTLMIDDAVSGATSGERYTASYIRAASGHNEAQSQISDILVLEEPGEITVNSRRIAVAGTVRIINNALFKSIIYFKRIAS